jgi:trk system potassium uptake protein TrkH
MARVLPVRMELPDPRVRSPALSPGLLIVYAFGALIAVGTLLLLLPFTHHGDGLTPIEDALFTATSATTVTGLVTVDTPSYWTRFGQLVILVMMFAGGLGIMTLASSLLVLAGQRVSLTQRLVMRETIGTAVLSNIANTTMLLVIWAVAAQAIGFVVLAIKFSSIYSAPDALWHALFQAVSGFNNAGFTSLPEGENMSAFQTDYVVVGTIALLIVLGSTGFWVAADVFRHRGFSTLSLNTKLVLIMTGILLVAGVAVFFAFESGNDATIGGLSTIDQLVTSAFHSVNRTSGFSVVDLGVANDQTNAFYTILMFIGGASASVAGGIKVNTAAIIVVAVVASIRGKTEASVFDRRLPAHQVQWAFALAILAFLAASVVVFLLTAIEDRFTFIDVLFESISAFATVGFSAGITPDLSVAGKLLLTAAMFVGRVVPPMVIVVALSQQGEGRPFRYPRDNVLVG